MDALTAKIDAVLREAFPGSDVTLSWPEDDDEYGKLLGIVIGEQFDGHDHLERQQMLWKVLRRKLTRPEQVRISAIFAETPAEKAALEQ